MNKLDRIAMEHIAGEMAIGAMTEDDARTLNVTIGFKIVATDTDGNWIILAEHHTVSPEIIERAIAMGYRWAERNYLEEEYE